MTLAGRVLFVLFYFAATITAAQTRSVHAARRFNAVSSVGAAVGSPARYDINAIPFFSHSKKPNPYVSVNRTNPVQIPVFIVYEPVFELSVQYESSPRIQTRNSRGPPMERLVF